MQTGRENNFQAQEVAESARRRTSSAARQVRRPKWDDAGEDLVALPEEAAAEEADDRLPPGLSWTDLPRFVRIFGWEKDNKEMRSASSACRDNPNCQNAS